MTLPSRWHACPIPVQFDLFHMIAMTLHDCYPLANNNLDVRTWLAITVAHKDFKSIHIFLDIYRTLMARALDRHIFDISDIGIPSMFLHRSWSRLTYRDSYYRISQCHSYIHMACVRLDYRYQYVPGQMTANEKILSMDWTIKGFQVKIYLSIFMARALDRKRGHLPRPRLRALRAFGGHLRAFAVIKCSRTNDF